MKNCGKWYLQKQASEVFSMSKCVSKYKDLPEQVFVPVKTHHICTN